MRRVDTPQRRVEAGRERLGDVGPFPEGRLGRLGPLPQGVVGLGQELFGRLEQPVVRQRQRRGPPRREFLERVEGQVQVEVRRRGGRAQHPGIGQPDADGVAGEEDPALGVVKPHVMLGVPR